MGVLSVARHSKCFWLPSCRGLVYNRAVLAGLDKNGGNLYVGRACHDGDLLPGKVAPIYGRAFVPYDGAEHGKDQYELLMLDRGQVEWVRASDGEVPEKALAVGHTIQGETLYSARVEHDGTTTPGKVHPSHGVCYISYGDVEYAYKEYEVLIIH